MMLKGGAALATVFLCFVLVLTLKDSQLCSQDVIRRVDVLITKAPKLRWLDSRLYTPSASDTEQNCIVSTLNCFAAEVEVLSKEWEKVGERVPRLDKLIQSLAKSVNKTVGSHPEASCRQCELLQEENAEKFLGDLLSTLQYVHVHFCKNLST